MSLTTIVSGLKLVSALAGQPDTTTVEQHEQMEFSKNNMEMHIADKDHTKARVNVFYGLPGNTKVYSFIELDGNGYFAKTMAYTPVNKKGTGVKTEMKNSNHFKDNIGIGLEQKYTVGGVHMGVKVLPLWTDLNGYKKNTVVAGGYVSKQWDVNILNRDFQVQVSAFGEVNVAAKNGPAWGYGEIDATVKIPTKIGQFDIGYGYDLYNQGNLMPNAVPRAKIGYHVKIN